MKRNVMRSLCASASFKIVVFAITKYEVTKFYYEKFTIIVENPCKALVADIKIIKCFYCPGTHEYTKKEYEQHQLTLKHQANIA